MKAADKEPFFDMLFRLAEGLDISPPPRSRCEFYFEAVCDLTLEQVAHALKRHVRTSPYFPKPSEILAAVEGQDDGHPDPESAWARAQGFADEYSTITWTEEMAQAYNLARSLIVAGDMVGARMAFKAEYQRLVRMSRMAGRPVIWRASLGFDAAGRRPSLIQAREDGHLNSGQIVRQVEGSTYAQTDAFLALETNASRDQSPAEAKARAALLELRRTLAGVGPGSSTDVEARMKTAALARDAAAAVKAYADVQGLSIEQPADAELKVATFSGPPVLPEARKAAA